MWIIKVTLDRPYTFIILALLILLLGPVIILRTPVDIFPNINIRVVSISWTYTGLNPEEFEGRITLPYEKALTTLVDNISIGHDYGDTVEVTAGLTPADLVVVNPSDSLVSGTRVAIDANLPTGVVE